MIYYPPVSPMAAGLGCKCPRCGQGDLFSGYLSVCPTCSACGLDLRKADSGDGPAIFAIFIVGFLAVAIAFILRFGLGAPIWLALLFSMAASLGLIFAILRPLKAMMIALQYANRAEEAKGDRATEPVFGEDADPR